ncbi:MAG TPA: acetyltransferase, partial [Nitrosomonas sp.]|nr:acetyltransferase [Nitrosomonas sp.]
PPPPLKVIILGAGGHSKVLADILLACNNATQTYSIVGILDDNRDLSHTMGIPILGTIANLKEFDHDAAIIAIGDNEVRADMYNHLIESGENLITLYHPKSYVANTAIIGSGTVLIGGAVVNADSKIGNNVIINTNATVGHDSIIEDHVHIAAGVHLGGGSVICEGAFLGMSACVLPGRTIGAWSTVGSGTVVTKDIPPGVTVVGVPARIINSKCRIELIRTQSNDKKSLLNNNHKHEIDNQQSCSGVDDVVEVPVSHGIFNVLDLAHKEEWNNAIKRCPNYDFYFLPSYNELEQKRTGSKAGLFVYEEESHLIAIPLLFRKVENSKILTQEAENLNDCSSVYGYAGPIASSPNLPMSVIHNFQKELRDAMYARSVISVFTRLHPLMAQSHLLGELGVLLQGGRTVSVDLSLSEEKQQSLYRENHIRDIKKLKKCGVEIFIDNSWSYLDAFIQMYYETMQRVHATPEYAFDTQYFNGLRDLKNGKSYLIFCSRLGELIAGGIFIECNGILEYHLGGTPDKYVKYAPMKMLLDGARSLGTSLGLQIFHLGGGVGSEEDSLFNFKLGFSDRTHDFLTWRWIVDQARYNALCEIVLGVGKTDLVVNPRMGYFPAYRKMINQDKADHSVET